MGNDNSTLNNDPNSPQLRSDYDENGILYSSYKDNISYSYIEKKGNTGDILLFCGSSIYSSGIKLKTMTPWTHIAVIIRNYKNEKGVFVLQAVLKLKKPVKDYLTNTEKDTGVMLNRFSDIWEEDINKIYYRKLDTGTYAFRESDIDNFLKEVKNKSYETNLLVLVSSADRSNVSEDKWSYFCSKLVYYFLIQTGFVEKTILIDNCIPSDFSPQFDKMWIQFKPFAKLEIMYRIQK